MEKLGINVRSKTALCVLILLFGTLGWAQTSGFTYQGKLNDGGAAASGTYDMRFRLFDGMTGEGQIGETQNLIGVQAQRGIFSVELDFGITAFSGEDRFLEIAISPSGQADFTSLSPRQKLGSSPYAIKSVNSTTADNALSLGGTAASQFVQTADPRMFDSRTPCREAAITSRTVQRRSPE